MSAPTPGDGSHAADEPPGLAGERTDLAWSRSGLAVIAAVGAIVKRVVDTRERAAAPFVVGALLLGGALAWAFAVAHARMIAATTLEGRTHADARKLRSVAYGTTALAAGALVLALLPDA